jgi:xanthine dehydrogenase YagS FAD-binding subunit
MAEGLMPQGSGALSEQLLAEAQPTAQNAFKVKLAQRTIGLVLAQASS